MRREAIGRCVFRDIATEFFAEFIWFTDDVWHGRNLSLIWSISGTSSAEAVRSPTFSLTSDPTP